MITHGEYVMEQKYDKLGPRGPPCHETDHHLEVERVHPFIAQSTVKRPSSEHTNVCEVPVM